MTAHDTDGSSRTLLTEAPVAPQKKWSRENPHAYAPSRAGVGPGEEMLAWEMGGRVMGGSVSYDVVDSSGERWEVKQPNAEGAVRIMAEGRKAWAPHKHALDEITRVISSGVSELGPAFLRSAGITPQEQSAVAAFIADDIPNISRGEITPPRMLGGKDTIGLLGTLRTLRRATQGSQSSEKRNLTFAGREHSVSPDVYLKIGRLLGMDRKELGLTRGEAAGEAFSHPAFSDPEEFIRAHWTEAMPADTVFGDTSGVVIVSQAGYTVIMREELNSRFKFYRISQGNPFFKLVQ